MNYGEVLTRAWQIIWKHKVLWIFGIFAGCSSQAGSTGSGQNFNFPKAGNTGNPGSNFAFPGLESFFQHIQTWQIVALIAALVIFVLVLIVIFTFLGTMGKIGLFRGTSLVEQGSEKLSFGELLKGGLPYFWRVFLLNLLVGIAIALGIGIIVVVLVISIVGICVLIPFICLLIPLSWAATIVIEQANIALVTENLGIMDAIQRGWEVAKTHIAEMLVMGLILVVGAMVAGIVLALPFIVVLVPALIGIATQTNTSLNAGLIISGLCLVAYLPVLILLNGILQSYIHSAWTLTYLRLTKQAPMIVVETGS